MSERSFDVVVIGAGPAGEVAAGRIAVGGLEVALVERHLVGGECSFYACMPSKALLRPGELRAEVDRVPGVAERVDGGLDVRAVLDRRDEVIHNRDDSSQLPWLEQRGIELFRGEATLDGERRVRVGDEVLEARRAVVIATGTSAALPPIDGLRDADPWTSREVTVAEEVPERMLVLGGGFVGVEMAQAYASLGSAVTVIEGGERILAREEPFASEQVAAGLERSGVTIRTESRAAGVASANGEVTLRLESGEELRGDRLVVATGRRPRTDGLGLEQVGIEADGYLEVDDQMRVRGSEWLYAVGDANGRSLLTHMGKYQARVCADHILGREDVAATCDKTGSPRVIFTDPEVAAVGRTLQQALDDGIDARAVDVETSANAGSSFRGRDTEGTSRIVIDNARGVIVGATFVGVETGELLQAATIAVVGEVPLERLWHAVPPFPTRNEVWLYLLEEAGL